MEAVGVHCGQDLLVSVQTLDHIQLGKQLSRESDGLPNLTINSRLSECGVLHLSQDGVRSAEEPPEG